MNKKTLAIIPARSGSKGVKDKNIKILNNKPLISYTIDAAKKCKFIDYVFVSTDSKKYADISKNFGANVPFLRSKKNSSDNSKSLDVIIEVLDNFKKQGMIFDIVILLQPTSPLRNVDDIVKSYNLFFEKKAKAVVSVNKINHPPHWSNTLPNDLSMTNFIDVKHVNKTRQGFSDYFSLNGAIFICKTSILESNLNIFKDGTFAYVMEKKNSIDIDSEFEFEIAELLIQKKN